MLPLPSVQSLHASLVLTFHAFLLATLIVLYAVADDGNELSRQYALANGSVHIRPPASSTAVRARPAALILVKKSI